MSTTSRTVTLPDGVGLHARPAGLLVAAVTASGHRTTIAKTGRDPVPANSILSVLGLAAEGGDVLTIEVEGEEAERVADELVALLRTDHDA